MKLTLLALPLWLLGCVHPALAGEASGASVLDGEAAASQCHTLMTEQECAEHLTQLALLPSGPLRSQYLAQFLNTKREREKLCACARSGEPMVYHPTVRQAALRF